MLSRPTMDPIHETELSALPSSSQCGWRRRALPAGKEEPKSTDSSTEKDILAGGQAGAEPGKITLLSDCRKNSEVIKRN